MEIPIQVISEQDDFDFRVVDGQALSASELEASLEPLAQECCTPVSKVGNPLGCRLITISPDRHILWLGLPSLCADAASLKTVVAEVGKLYAGASLDEEPLQYLQFSEWCNELLEGEDAAEGLSFWRRRGAESARNPALPLEGGSPAHASAVRTLELPQTLFDRVAAASQGSTTLADLLSSSWQVLLFKLAEGGGFRVYGRLEGRKYEELAESVGLFASYTPCPVSFNGDLSWSQVVQRTSCAREEAETWQEYAAAGEEAEAPGGPVGFEVDSWPPEATYGGVRFLWQDLRSDLDRFKLRLAVWQHADRLVLRFHYDPNVLSRAGVDRLAEELTFLLDQVLQRPELTLAELETVGPRERRLLVDEWNATDRDFPTATTLVELFRRQAEASPTALAVAGEEHLTYAGSTAALKRSPVCSAALA